MNQKIAMRLIFVLFMVIVLMVNDSISPFPNWDPEHSNTIAAPSGGTSLTPHFGVHGNCIQVILRHGMNQFNNNEILYE